MGMDLKDEDYIEHLFVASTHDYILFFTSVGKVYRSRCTSCRSGRASPRGGRSRNLLPFTQEEQIRAVVQTRDFKDANYLVFGTKKGVVKKTRFEEYNTPLKADGIIAIKLREGDELIGVRHSSGEEDVLMVSRKGQAVRFHEREARPMGRSTEGVRGMKLREGDEVIEINIAQDDADLLVVTENGYGKRTRIGEYRRVRRGGLGVKTVQLTEARGKLVGARVVRDGYQVMLISTAGTVIRTRRRDPPRRSRDAGRNRDEASWRRRTRLELGAGRRVGKARRGRRRRVGSARFGLTRMGRTCAKLFPERAAALWISAWVHPSNKR